MCHFHVTKYSSNTLIVLKAIYLDVDAAICIQLFECQSHTATDPVFPGAPIIFEPFSSIKGGTCLGMV